MDTKVSSNLKPVSVSKKAKRLTYGPQMLLAWLKDLAQGPSNVFLTNVSTSSSVPHWTEILPILLIGGLGISKTAM